MMTHQLRLPSIASAMLLAATLLPAAAKPKLVVGSPAPPLATGAFLQGDPVEKFEPGTTYLIEFLASGFPVCKTATPIVNKLHQRFADKGLVVIGQSLDQDAGKMQEYLDEIGGQMTYRVALDEKSDDGFGKMGGAWLMAAGDRGLPISFPVVFVVDQTGAVAWIGKPADLGEPLLASIINGSYDTKTHAAAQKQERDRTAQLQALESAYKQALIEGDLEKASAAADQIESCDHPNSAWGSCICRFQIAMKAGDGKAASKHARAFLTHEDSFPYKKEYPGMLASVFVKPMCDAHPMEGLDMQVAVQLMDKASALTGGKLENIEALLTRARALAK